ncbi:MAG: SH3 domain-containing protein, partial [Chloroflexota bacterium]
PEETLPAPSGLTVYTMAGLNLRAKPSTGATIRGTLPAGEALSVLGDIDQARSKISKEGEWLQVQTASGLPGYVAAWFVHTMEQALPPSELIVYPNDLLNMRSGPGIIYDLLATKEVTDPLTVLGDTGNARSKIGKQDEWLQVQTQDGVRGFVAAWLVHTTGQPIPASDLIVYPLVVLNVRARPIIGANLLTVVTPNDPLRVLGDGLSARERIGIKDQWLEVLTPLGHRGFVAAWLVQLPSTKPSTDQTLVRLDVFPTVDLNIRAQASINSPRVGGAFHGEALQVIDADLEGARALIGKEDEWIHVETKDGSRGWAAAWFLSTEQV